MQSSTRTHTILTAAGLAVASTAAMAIAPSAPVGHEHAPPVVSADVRLVATEVPPGGLVTSFLGNQVIYCSIICPLVVQTGATAVVTTVQTPATFLGALQAGDLLRALGATAASVTGPTNAAAAATILADGSRVAPRAFNAFEVGVVGLLNVVPAAAGGLPGVLAAVQSARQDTFDALNAPIVPNPTPTVTPHGFVQVAVVSLLNVGGAVIFPAFNDVLGATTAVPDAMAQELAASGDPARAVAAGIAKAAEAGNAAVSVIADTVVTAAEDIRAAAGPAAHTSTAAALQTTSAATKSEPSVDAETPASPATTIRSKPTANLRSAADPGPAADVKPAAPKPPSAQSATSHPLRQLAAEVRKAVHNAVTNEPPKKPSPKSADEHPHDGSGADN
jgi:hypothetical protein